MKHKQRFYSKSIGTNEKAVVLVRNAQEPTKKHWIECEMHRNQRKNNFNMKSIGTNNKALALL